jgi:hypothetical protein
VSSSIRVDDKAKGLWQQLQRFCAGYLEAAAAVVVSRPSPHTYHASLVAF